MFGRLNILSDQRDQKYRGRIVGLLLGILLPALVLCSFSIPILVTDGLFQGFLYGAAAAFLAVSLVEISFRLLHRVFLKRPYRIKPKVPFHQIFVEPHPYLPYVYKKNFKMERERTAEYALHVGKYTLPALRTNNFRHANGPDGGRDIIVPKPPGLIRICCLGASTTDNYIGYKGTAYSYPLALEGILQRRFPGLEIEVNNCGMMGYTSAEIITKFFLSTIDTDPDIVVFHHAKNDLPASLTPGFSSDYSHSRRNFGEAYHRFRLASLFPHIPLASYNAIMTSVLHQSIRNGVLFLVERERADISRSFLGLETYRRNIEHLIAVCKSRGITLVLSTYPYFLYPWIRNDVVHMKYHEGVQQENAVVRELAKRHDLRLSDNAVLMPNDEKYFVDSVHYTPEGMQLLAENISIPIAESLEGSGQATEGGDVPLRADLG
jgi:lysophospholipase L1-like esterase